MVSPRRSPMQMFRRLSQDEDAKTLITYELTSEKPVTFTDVRHSIYPIVKQWSWIKKAKDSLHSSSDEKYHLVSKHLSSINQGIVYALFTNDRYRYISTADISVWKITEKDLQKNVRENFLKKVAILERTGPLFSESQTGIFVCTRLQDLTASLLAVPEIFNMIGLKQNPGYVVAMPTPEVILVTHCHDSRGMCVIGEACLRQGTRDLNNNTNNNNGIYTRPIRIDKKGGLSFYEGSLVRNEAAYPFNEDQLRHCKKSYFKRSRKLSINSPI